MRRGGSAPVVATTQITSRLLWAKAGTSDASTKLYAKAGRGQQPCHRARPSHREVSGPGNSGAHVGAMMPPRPLSSRHICQRATSSLKISGAPWRSAFCSSRKLFERWAPPLVDPDGSSKPAGAASEKGARVIPPHFFGSGALFERKTGHPGLVELAPLPGFRRLDGTLAQRTA